MPRDMSAQNQVVTVRRNFEEWSPLASQVLETLKSLTLPQDHPWMGIEDLIDLQSLNREWRAYYAWLQEWEGLHGESERVFAHNDAQYGNLLKLKNLRKGAPSHHQVRSFELPLQPRN